MSKTTRTKSGVAAVAVIGATCVGLAVGGSAAGADPDSSGQTTIGVPSNSIIGGALEGITATAVAPATATNDETAMTVDYAFPVTGGNANLMNGYGQVRSSGGVTISDAMTATSTELDNFLYSPSSGLVKAVPAGMRHPINFGRVRGTQVIMYGENTPGEQHLHATRLTLNPAGAAYLNSALNTTDFSGGDFVGTFDEDFVYTAPAN